MTKIIDLREEPESPPPVELVKCLQNNSDEFLAIKSTISNQGKVSATNMGKHGKYSMIRVDYDSGDHTWWLGHWNNGELPKAEKGIEFVWHLSDIHGVTKAITLPKEFDSVTFGRNKVKLQCEWFDLFMVEEDGNTLIYYGHINNGKIQ